MLFVTFVSSIWYNCKLHKTGPGKELCVNQLINNQLNKESYLYALIRYERVSQSDVYLFVI